MGFLESNSKATHTLSSYQIDLMHFHRFLERHQTTKNVSLQTLTQKDLKDYYLSLKIEKLKNNTRRRKLLTVRKFLRYLQARKVLKLNLSEQVLAPAKLERVPKAFDYQELLDKIKLFPEVDNISKRNKALLWTLLETGCQVHEIRGLKFDLLRGDVQDRFQIHLTGKSERSIDISPELFHVLEGLREPESKSPWIFTGYNRFGSMGGPITSRGVELMVKVLAKQWKLNELTPRTFRHTSILHWFKNKMPPAEIQKRLGLKSQYTLKHYTPLLSRATEPKESEQ